MKQDLSFFKAYDIRGTVPEQLNTDVAYDIGRAYAAYLKPKKVIVGHDIRLSSEQLSLALSQGLMDSGVDVIHIGECGTEEVYFSVFDLKVDGGICVTASHNPSNYNGMKFVAKDSKPIGTGTGLEEIKSLLISRSFVEGPEAGKLINMDRTCEYTSHILKYVDRSLLKPLSLVVNPGNGGAGKVVDSLSNHLPFSFVKLQFEADGNFPNGVPNPLLLKNRESTSKAVLQSNADFGIAWDGDFDRCFFFDEKGVFIEGYYIVCLLAQATLDKKPNAKIVYDPRLYWATQSIVENRGGTAIACQSGHAFIKQKMRDLDADYGGEMSAHHYFKDFSYCDNGTIPWLLVAEIVCKSGKTLSTLVADFKKNFPCSGEINLTVKNSDLVMQAIKNEYAPNSIDIDELDGLGISFKTWRFNVRQSNTEPLLRVNVETLGNESLLETKTQEILFFIKRLES